MVTEIRIYYEGDPLLKPGFDAFFTGLRERAKEKRCGFRLIAAKGTPCRDFGIAIQANTGAWNILLKDSEGPDARDLSASLCRQNEWSQSHAESIFWMVEMMESWFHADKDALKQLYGSEFRKNSLKANPNVEQISKKDLKDGLSAATRAPAKATTTTTRRRTGQSCWLRLNPSWSKKQLLIVKSSFRLSLRN